MPPMLLSLLLNRYTVGALLVAGLVAGAYWKGYSTASANCQEAQLRAVIATQARDLKAWELADAAAKDEQARLAAELIELQQMVTDYEKELLLKPAPACALTDDDARRLRGIGAK